MKVTGKSRTIKSRALTDPKPEFVSLVTAAANLTPFAVTKMDKNAEGEAGMTVRTRGSKPQTKEKSTKSEDATPASVIEEARKIDGHQIASISFTKGDIFADEASVKAWLDDGGYTEYEIVEVKSEDAVTGWAVKNDSVEFDGDPRIVPGGSDVEIAVAKVKAEATGDNVETGEETETAEKSEAANGLEGGVPDDETGDEDASQKSDEAVKPVANSEGDGGDKEEEASKSETTEETASEDAPAVVELTDAAKELLAKSAPQATEGEETAKKSIWSVESLMDAVQKLYWIVYDDEWAAQSAAEEAPAHVGKLRALIAEALNIVADMAKAEAKLVVKSDASAKSEENVTPDVTEIVKAAMTPLAEAMAELTKGITTITQKMDANQKEIGDRVEALENRAQTRKSASIEETTTVEKKADASTSSEEDDDEAWLRNRSRRSAFGVGYR